MWLSRSPQKKQETRSALHPSGREAPLALMEGATPSLFRTAWAVSLDVGRAFPGCLHPGGRGTAAKASQAYTPLRKGRFLCLEVPYTPRGVCPESVRR